MVEGVGDAAQLDRVYSTVFSSIYSLFLLHMPDMYRLVLGELPEVRFAVPAAVAKVGSRPLTVKVLVGEKWMQPGYNDRDNSITILIRPWLERAGWAFRPNRVLPINLGRDRFMRDMEKSLSYNMRSVMDTPSVCRLLAHELIHCYDSETMPGMMRRRGNVDSFEGGRRARVANNHSGYLEWARDTLFPPAYVNTRFTGRDHEVLKRVRQSFGPADLNIFMHRKGTPEYDQLIRRSNLYKHQMYLSSIPEMRARVGEQLPWLLTRRGTNADRIDVQATVAEMMDNVFAIPGTPTVLPSRFRDANAYREHHYQKALPDARRSVARRLAKLACAANGVDVERYCTVPARLHALLKILEADRNQ